MSKESRSVWTPGFGQIWVAAIAIAEVTSVYFEVGPPLQPLLSVVFVMTVPGLVILDMEQPSAFTARLMLGVVGSIGLNVALVTVGLIPSFIWLVSIGVLGFWGILRYVEARLVRSEAELHRS